MKTTRNLFLITLLLIWGQFFSLAAQAGPLAPKKHTQIQVHGHELNDDWKWLADREAPELFKVFKAEEKYAKSQFRGSSNLDRELYREFTQFDPRQRSSHPYLRDGYYYFSRSYKGKPYDSHFRIKDEPGAKEELLLDEQKLARGKKFFSLGVMRVSPDAEKLVYSVDYEGDENYRLFIRDLSQKKNYDTGIDRLDQALWFNDSKRLLLTRNNERFQCDQVSIYDLQSGTLQSLYKEEDPARNLGIWSSTDHQYFFMSSSAAKQNRIWCFDAGAQNPELMELSSSWDNCQAWPDHLGGAFYLMTDLFNADHGVYRFDADSPRPEYWVELVPAESGRPLDSMVLMDSVIAVTRRNDGFKSMELYDVDGGGLIRTVSSSVPADIDFWYNYDPSAPQIMYGMEHELQPYSIISHNLSDGSETVVYQSEIAQKRHHDLYQTELHWVEADDGAQIPLRLVKRRDLDPQTTHPLWLQGYGAYGSCEDPYYSHTLFSLLDRGFICATAHIRGGGEFGRYWHDQGRTLSKKNTFSDFEACIDYLISKGFTEPSKLIIEGGSAGGLLIGAVLNQAPQKFRLAIADVPFVDLINTMLDPELPLTVQEYEEWGDPSDEEQFSYMLSYSPYDNVKPQTYPTVLVTTAWNDIRVGYWESLKWVQKLRENNLGENPVIYLMGWDEGHSGSEDHYRRLKNYAKVMAFAIRAVTPK
ncbi:MAG: S9 family peptidase [Candidatus Cloacimonetes bacterium]|nr:S9 family peptidase [Candidatus Cloacimonadota bacterium]